MRAVTGGRSAIIRAAALSLFPILIVLTGGCAGRGSGPGEAGYQEMAQKEFGISIVALRVIAGGYLLDLRYRVVDKERAKEFLDPRRPLTLIHQSSGKILQVPNPPKIGPLRQIPPPGEMDKIYFCLFANPGRLVKLGDLVGLKVGSKLVKGIPVE